MALLVSVNKTLCDIPYFTVDISDEVISGGIEINDPKFVISLVEAVKAMAINSGEADNGDEVKVNDEFYDLIQRVDFEKASRITIEVDEDDDSIVLNGISYGSGLSNIH